MDSVCVFCGSRDGNNPAYLAAARATGRAIARRGWKLVYGGGHVGLMGALADAALAEDGEVIGVMPRALLDPRDRPSGDHQDPSGHQHAPS